MQKLHRLVNDVDFVRQDLEYDLYTRNFHGALEQLDWMESTIAELRPRIKKLMRWQMKRDRLRIKVGSVYVGGKDLKFLRKVIILGPSLVDGRDYVTWEDKFGTGGCYLSSFKAWASHEVNEVSEPVV